MDFTQEVLAVTGGVIVGSFLLRCLIRKCKREYFSTPLTFGKRDCYDVPANTPQPPIEEQKYPQPSAPYYEQNNPYNSSYSSYPQDNRFVVYIPPPSQIERHI